MINQEGEEETKKDSKGAATWIYRYDVIEYVTQLEKWSFYEKEQADDTESDFLFQISVSSKSMRRICVSFVLCEDDTFLLSDRAY